MRTKLTIVATMLLFVSTFNACKKDEQPELAKPTIENVEIGLNNNEIGVIDRDFHLEFDINAGNKIDVVEIKIEPKAGESYAKPWSHTITWTEFKGSKNTNVHKHFNIPTDAVEGRYDFIITVKDENGTLLEEKRNITIYTAASMPVNPSANIFNVALNDAVSPYIRNGVIRTPGTTIKKNDKFTSQISIGNVKGDGKMYLLLINKKHNHRPESIDKIDFSKAIVYDVLEHKGIVNSSSFSNAQLDTSTNPFTIIRASPSFMIGATSDNNAPTPSPINGAKAWESGTYYYGVVYHNSSYKMGYYQYVEIPVEIN